MRKTGFLGGQVLAEELEAKLRKNSMFGGRRDSSDAQTMTFVVLPATQALWGLSQLMREDAPWADLFVLLAKVQHPLPTCTCCISCIASGRSMRGEGLRMLGVHAKVVTAPAIPIKSGVLPCITVWVVKFFESSGLVMPLLWGSAQM